MSLLYIVTHQQCFWRVMFKVLGNNTLVTDNEQQWECTQRRAMNILDSRHIREEHRHVTFPCKPGCLDSKVFTYHV